MENSAVPPRPGFDLQARGYNPSQVIDHVERLEEQLRTLAGERDEAVRFAADLDTEFDDAASADEHDRAVRKAEIIVARAEAEARELINEAEQVVAELRSEGAELATEMESRRDNLRREHAKKANDLRAREQRLRRTIRREYKRLMTSAQEEADELIARSRKQCQQYDTETEERRLDALEEIKRERDALDKARQVTLSALSNASSSIGSCSAALYSLHATDGHATDGNNDGATTVPIPVPINGSPQSQ